jgi:hypothetical protein
VSSSVPARTPRNAIADGKPDFGPLQMIVAHSGQIHRVAVRPQSVMRWIGRGSPPRVVEGLVSDNERHRECAAQEALTVSAVAGVDRNWHTGDLVTKRAAKAAAILRDLHERTPSLVEGRIWSSCIASMHSTTISWPLDNRQPRWTPGGSACVVLYEVAGEPIKLRANVKEYAIEPY